MKKQLYILFLLPFIVFAQEQQVEQKQGSNKEPEEEVKIKLADKQVLRKGNDLYREKKYADAEAKYKKALRQNKYYKTAYYNLSNTMYSQDKFKESLPGYELVAKTTDDKEFKAQTFHNIGNVLMKEKQYAKAISAYKNSLRLNPNDDETRYNLALAQDLLKNQQNQNDKDNKDNKENEDKDQDKKDQNSENKEEQGDEDKKDQEQDKGENNEDKEDQDKGGNNEQENKQKPKPEPNKLSQQQIQQLLEAMNNEENKTQKKVNAKKASGQKVKKEKDW